MAYYLSILCFYYPVGAAIIVFGGIPNSVFNQGLRGLLALIAAIGVTLALTRNKFFTATTSYGLNAILLFWVVYAVRITHDLSTGVVFGLNSSVVVYGFAFGAILLPILLVMCYQHLLDPLKIERACYHLIFLGGIAIVALFVLRSETVTLDILSARGSIRAEGDDTGALINPITVSYYGALLVVFSLYRAVYGRLNLVFALVAGAVGLILIAVGASRGPVLNLIICILVVVALKIHDARYKVYAGLKYVAFGICGAFVIFLGLRNNIDTDKIYLITRLTQFAEARKTQQLEYRDYQRMFAVEDFKDSPFIGKQFVGTWDNFYPHNIIIEVPMALGVVGIVLALAVIFGCLISVRYILVNHLTNYYIYLVAFCPALLSGLVSGALFQAIEIWCFLTLIATVTTGFTLSHISNTNRVGSSQPNIALA